MFEENMLTLNFKLREYTFNKKKQGKTSLLENLYNYIIRKYFSPKISSFYLEKKSSTFYQLLQVFTLKKKSSNFYQLLQNRFKFVSKLFQNLRSY